MRRCSGRRALRACVPVAAGAGAAVLGLTVAVLSGLPGEASLLRAMWVGRDTAAYAFAQGVDGATGSWPLVAIGVLLGLLLRSVQVPAAVALAAVVTAGAKRLVARSRPELMSPLEAASPFSYPAGHAAAAAALVVAVLLAVPRGRRAPVAVIGGVIVMVSAWAQLVLTRHFPSDLVGGWLTGVAVATAVAWSTQSMAGSAYQ